MNNKILLLLLFPLLSISCQAKPTPILKKNNTSSPSEAQAANHKNSEAPSDTILQYVDYTKADSAKVVDLLKLTPKGNDVLFYARQFKGVPYVASTLEKHDPELLVVNLRQLDCTTLVETTLALAITKRQGKTDFTDYCSNLMHIRYWNGEMKGYLSRLHYFSWWMHNNIDKGVVEMVNDKQHFTSMINVQNHYMSQHPDKYKYLKLHPEWVDSIATLEEKYNGPDGYYLPQRKTLLSKGELNSIHDGDIIAIVTKKDGIDYSHLGFAVWQKDNKLHLLNASSIHHKVVEEPKTLYQYLKEHPSSIGIRLLRLK